MLYEVQAKRIGYGTIFLVISRWLNNIIDVRSIKFRDILGRSYEEVDSFEFKEGVLNWVIKRMSDDTKFEL